MRAKLSKHQFENIRRSPALFLAYCGVRAAVRHLTITLRIGDLNGLRILLAPPNWEVEAYFDAVRLLTGATRESNWVAENDQVYLFEPDRRKPGLDRGRRGISGAHRASFIVGNRLDDIPLELRMAADEVVQVRPPTPEHLNAFRKLAGRAPFEPRAALEVSTWSQGFVLAALRRRNPDFDDFRSSIKSTASDVSAPTLFDLPGYANAKDWARSVIGDIDLWRGGELPWHEVRSSVLLSGPPGVGKTFFAAAFATAARLKLFTATVGKWQAGGHLGETLKAMKETFAEANRANGCVLFIDELDSIGDRVQLAREREQSYWRVVINELLSQLSTVGEGVIILGATNYPEAIDAAILRSGRIEDRLDLDLPDLQERADILSYHLEWAIDPAKLADLVAHLDGKTGADLEKIARKAKRRARQSGRALEVADVRAELCFLMKHSIEDQFRFAVHETGHALAALNLGRASRCTVSISEFFDPNAVMERGGTASIEYSDRYVMTDATLLDRIAILLAGMAAEEAVFTTRSIGAGGGPYSDLGSATTLARQYVGSFGLGRCPIFLRSLVASENSFFPSEFEAEVSELLKKQYDRVLELFQKEKDHLVAFAREAALHKKVTIDITRKVAAQNQDTLT